MDYFDAVKEGRARIGESMDVLQKLAGPCYPMLFLKLGVTPWTPVGKEMLHKTIPGKNSTAAVVICDGEGNSKAMSPWLPELQAQKVSKDLELQGIPEFPGDVKLPI